jgi:hypothetical protein
MNCLQSRRLLLAAPREHSSEHRAHIQACATCARLAQQLPELERSIEDAVLVPIPDALTHRVLLRRRGRRVWQYAAAAVVAIATVLGGLWAADVVDTPDFPSTLQAVGPMHPAIAAIAEVMADTARPATTDSTEMEVGLKDLGLMLKRGQTSAHYVGKCHIEGSTECEHIVLSTPDAYANVMLMPDYQLTDRMLVSEGHMVALVNPAGKGSYIVVAKSPKMAKRVSKLLVRRG